MRSRNRSIVVTVPTRHAAIIVSRITLHHFILQITIDIKLIEGPETPKFSSKYKIVICLVISNKYRPLNTLVCVIIVSMMPCVQMMPSYRLKILKDFANSKLAIVNEKLSSDLLDRLARGSMTTEDCHRLSSHKYTRQNQSWTG